MRPLIKTIVTILIVLCFSCEDQGLTVKCPDCTADEPVSTFLEVKLNTGNLVGETLINVYEGNIEDSIIYKTFYTTAANITIDVKLNKKYTVSAIYYISDNYYIAVDSAFPRVKFDKTTCDDPCFYVYDKTIDLRLKYNR